MTFLLDFFQLQTLVERPCTLIHFCFTEKWLSEKITDISIDGFKIIRFGRDTTRTRKLIGGGLRMAVNTKWAANWAPRSGAVRQITNQT